MFWMLYHIFIGPDIWTLLLLFSAVFGYCAGVGQLLAFEFLFLTAAVNVITSSAFFRYMRPF